MATRQTHGLFSPDDRLMIQRLVTIVEIARSESAANMAEASLEDTGQFYSAMGVLQHARTGAGFEQERA